MKSARDKIEEMLELPVAKDQFRCSCCNRVISTKDKGGWLAWSPQERKSDIQPVRICVQCRSFCTNHKIKYVCQATVPWAVQI